MGRFIACAPARTTQEGDEVVAFHLHRFLAVCLEHYGLAELYVTFGFEGSGAAPGTFRVGLDGADPVEVGWGFEDLCHTYRRGDGRLHLESRTSPGGRVLFSVPILDRPSSGGRARIALGFLLLPEGGGLGEEAIDALQVRAYESICAARRNAVRLFFDEHRDDELKSLIYNAFEHLPEWCGVDFSASLVLTTSLETMTLERASSPHFNVLAERIYDLPERAPERLVGMRLSVSEAPRHLLSLGFERQRDDADLPYQLYRRCEGGGWEALEIEGVEPAAPYHCARGRQEERLIGLVPLIAREASEAELIGFLVLTWRSEIDVPSSVGELLAEIGAGLAPLVRHSSLYALGARKLWILRRMRREVERLIAQEAPSSDRVEGLIAAVSRLIASHVEVPSFAIASLGRDQGGARVLRYAHPHGWAHYESLELPVDADRDDPADTGVSALSIRMGRPLVLAGGSGEGDALTFKNSVYVCEADNELRDARAEALDARAWVPLSAYYKPARTGAYATLAYPITFDGVARGVVTIEVDRSTDWLWWTGFGGHLFWQMVASELAGAFFHLIEDDEV